MDRALNPQEIWGLYSHIVSPRAGELNADYKVDLADLLIFAAQWLWAGLAGGIIEDIVANGVVDLTDFARLANNWRSQLIVYSS